MYHGPQESPPNPAHRTLRDIRNNNSLMLQYYCQDISSRLAHFFPKGAKVVELNVSIKSSALWHHEETLNLSTNMRSQLLRDQSAEEFV